MEEEEDSEMHDSEKEEEADIPIRISSLSAERKVEPAAPAQEEVSEEEGTPTTPNHKITVDVDVAPSPKRQETAPQEAPGSPSIDDPRHELWQTAGSIESRAFVNSEAVDALRSTESRARSRSPLRGRAPPSLTYQQEEAAERRLKEDEDNEPLLRA